MEPGLWNYFDGDTEIELDQGPVPKTGMSALGQKQTYAVQNGMSALPPKADIRCYLSNVR